MDTTKTFLSVFGIMMLITNTITKFAEVQIKCDTSTMTALLTVENTFVGKVYAMVNPEECFTSGEPHSNHVAITLPLKSTACGTKNLGNGTFTNTIIVQHHPTILRSTDRRIDVVCDYEEHKVRLKAGKQVIQPDSMNITSVVTGVAPTPVVRLRIVNPDGNDVAGVDLGSDIVLRAELLDEGIYGIMGTSLVASSGDGSENMTLIDEHGCPTETSVFPALDIAKDSKSLEAVFQAFRFASDSTVRFQITISFCLNVCNPVYCDSDEGVNATSYGRKRRALGGSKPSGLHQGDIVSDIVMESALFVRARLERQDIQEDDSASQLSTGPSVIQPRRQTYCTSPAVIISVSIFVAVIQIGIASCCVIVTFGGRQTTSEQDRPNRGISRLPSIISTSSKTTIYDSYSSACPHNSLASYLH